MIIYKATFPNGKSYIGQTTLPIKIRGRNHKYRALKTKANSPFYNAIRKYGFECIVWKIIEHCKNWKEMQEREKFLIKFHETMSPKGYNAVEGGRQPVFTQLHRKNLSKALQGRKMPKMSENQKRAISEANKKFYSNPKNKQKISFWRSNRKFRTIQSISLGGKIKEYTSIKIASEKTGISKSSITNALYGYGGAKTAGGYYWKLKKQNGIKI